MKIRSRLLTKLGGLGVAAVTRVWMSTLDYRAALYDPTLDPIHPDFRSPAIFLFWHEYILIPFYLRGHSNITMLLSRHHDAEWLSAAARHMGFQTVRGSTNRGGVQAIRELFRKSRSTNLAITPDGPRGPRRRLAPGAVYLASRLGLPLVAIGLGYDRPWRVRRAWDQFAIPRPYSRACAVMSPALHVPAGLDRHALEIHRQRIEATLQFVTGQAEDWAASGGRLENQFSPRREGISLEIRSRRAA